MWPVKYRRRLSADVGNGLPAFVLKRAGNVGFAESMWTAIQPGLCLIVQAERQRSQEAIAADASNHFPAVLLG